MQQDSTYSEKQTVFALLGELWETVKHIGVDHPLPTIIIEIASQALIILDDPSHKMYGKVNHFLNKGPVWELSRVLPYWIERILGREPEDDNGYRSEVTWLLQLLVDGLRSIEVG